MKEGLRRGFCVLLSVVLAAAGIPCTAAAVENGITVSSREEFMAALAQKKSPITVNGLITIGQEAGGRMLPVRIPAGTEILGQKSTDHLNCRAPIQLEGDISFKN
ncbi:MAG: hypothetical protein HFG38_10295, partial [Eubacterium sp.]|nr:hypothetical protein [Eubacterium sp.]